MKRLVILLIVYNIFKSVTSVGDWGLSTNPGYNPYRKNRFTRVRRTLLGRKFDPHEGSEVRQRRGEVEGKGEKTGVGET